MFGIGWRLDRIWADVTKSARHADAIRPDPVSSVVVLRIVIVLVRVPVLRRGFVKIRIRKQSHADNSRRVTVIGAHGHLLIFRQELVGLAFRQILTAPSDSYTRILLFILKWIGRAVGRNRLTFIEPQTEPVRIRPGGFFKAWLIDQTEIMPTIIATGPQARM